MSTQDAARRLYVASRKGLLTLVPEASPPGWRVETVAFLGDPVSMVLSDPRDGTLYAALNLGHFGAKLRRSANGGESWEEVACPVYPPKPEDPEDRNTWSLQQLWCLEAGGADEPGTLWAGTIPGGLFRSTDRGDSWQLIESLWLHPDRREWFGGGYDMPGIHSIHVDPRDARRVQVAISCGGVWETRDGGSSWQSRCKGMRALYMPPERQEDPRIQDPHRMVACPSAPDHLWASHHTGVYRSSDGGDEWQAVTAIRPTDFGFATAVHPHDPATAWFVPAVKDECRVPADGRLVVARTRDHGATFEVLGDGLPARHAYHLVYRHALDVDGTGERLAMGSTTGGLWTSSDGGDHWHPVSQDLPPIYAVRFG
jgi:hypothetical protein